MLVIFYLIFTKFERQYLFKNFFFPSFCEVNWIENSILLKFILILVKKNIAKSFSWSVKFLLKQLFFNCCFEWFYILCKHLCKHVFVDNSNFQIWQNSLFKTLSPQSRKNLIKFMDFCHPWLLFWFYRLQVSSIPIKNS